MRSQFTDDIRFNVLIFPSKDTLYVDLPKGRRVPQQFTALIFRPMLSFTLGVFVEPDGSGVCTSIACTSEVEGERPWITDVLANLPDMGLRAWVQYAVTIAARAEQEPDVTAWPQVPGDLTQETDARQFWREIAEATHEQPTRRRKMTTLTRLQQVATLYNAALADQRHDPTVAVAEGLSLSRSQAAKLVQQCRRTSPPLLQPVNRKRKDDEA